MKRPGYQIRCKGRTPHRLCECACVAQAGGQPTPQKHGTCSGKEPHVTVQEQK